MNGTGTRRAGDRAAEAKSDWSHFRLSLFQATAILVLSWHWVVTPPTAARKHPNR